jgi:hypothetical protein
MSERPEMISDRLGYPSHVGDEEWKRRMKDPMTDDDFRREVCDWFRANGLDPKTLPAQPQASITDGQLTSLRKVQRNGCDVIHQGELLVETVTVPLVVEPSPDIAEWLRPRCPTCGR